MDGRPESWNIEIIIDSDNQRSGAGKCTHRTRLCPAETHGKAFRRSYSYRRWPQREGDDVHWKAWEGRYSCTGLLEHLGEFEVHHPPPATRRPPPASSFSSVPILPLLAEDAGKRRFFPTPSVPLVSDLPVRNVDDDAGDFGIPAGAEVLCFHECFHLSLIRPSLVSAPSRTTSGEPSGTLVQKVVSSDSVAPR